MINNTIKTRTSVYNITYHVAWAVKHRVKILAPDIEEYLKTLIYKIAQDKGFNVHSVKVIDMDYVECYVSSPPKMSITMLLKYLKGITGRKIKEQFPDIQDKLYKGEIWNHSFYIETIGTASEEELNKYIEAQNNSY